jgi:hypothetical protein
MNTIIVEITRGAVTNVAGVPDGDRLYVVNNDVSDRDPDNVTYWTRLDGCQMQSYIETYEGDDDGLDDYNMLIEHLNNEEVD